MDSNSKLELIDIDGYFCLYSENRIEDYNIPDTLFHYQLRKKREKIIEIKDIKAVIQKENEYGGDIISRIPIYYNSHKDFRYVSCCEFLGVFSTIFGYSSKSSNNI